MNPGHRIWADPRPAYHMRQTLKAHHARKCVRHFQCKSISKPGKAGHKHAQKPDRGGLWLGRPGIYIPPWCIHSKTPYIHVFQSSSMSTPGSGQGTSSKFVHPLLAIKPQHLTVLQETQYLCHLRGNELHINKQHHRKTKHPYQEQEQHKPAGDARRAVMMLIRAKYLLAAHLHPVFTHGCEVSAFLLRGYEGERDEQ